MSVVARAARRGKRDGPFRRRCAQHRGQRAAKFAMAERSCGLVESRADGQPGQVCVGIERHWDPFSLCVAPARVPVGRTERSARQRTHAVDAATSVVKQRTRHAGEAEPWPSRGFSRCLCDAGEQAFAHRRRHRLDHLQDRLGFGPSDADGVATAVVAAVAALPAFFVRRGRDLLVARAAGGARGIRVVAKRRPCPRQRAVERRLHGAAIYRACQDARRQEPVFASCGGPHRRVSQRRMRLTDPPVRTH